MVRFVPDRRYTAASAVGLVLAVILFLVADDAPTRLLIGLAALVLAGYVVGDLVFSPRVEADESGVVIRAPMTRARLAWSEIDYVRADVAMHHGLRSVALEIDAGDVLAVLSRRSIGTDPERAAELIRARRPVA